MNEKANSIVFKDCMFTLNNLDQFLLVGLGRAVRSDIQEKMSDKEIVEEYITDLEFPISNDVDAYGVYRGDLKLTFTKEWTDCGYEHDSEVEIDNIILIQEV